MKKRLLSALMVFCMVLTLLPVSAFAADPPQNPGDVSAEKTAVYNEETGQVTITLNVQGKDLEETVPAEKPVDVVLVVDNSGSMDEGGMGLCGGTGWTSSGWSIFQVYRCNQCGAFISFLLPPNLVGYDGCDHEKTKMTAAQNAAYTLVESIATAGTSNRVGIVSFEGNSGGTSSSELVEGACIGLTSLSEQNAIQTLYETIDAMRASGGTNYTAGLAQAQTYLSQSQDRAQYVIFISDGEPGRSGESTGNPLWDGSEQAQALKAAGVQIYAIGMNVNDPTALQNLASEGEGYYTNFQNESTMHDDLAALIKEITEAITTVSRPAGTNAVFTDTVANGFTVDEQTVEGLTIVGNTVTWTVGDITEAGKTVSFTVTPKDTTTGDKVSTNQGATLTYTKPDGTTDTIDVDSAVVNIPGYRVTYDANGGEGVVTDSNSYRKNATVTVQGGSSLTKDDATFLGWSEAKTDLIKSEEAATEVEFVTSMTITDNITLFAVWAADTNGNGIPDYKDEKFTVTYNANGGSGSVEDTNEYLNGSTVTVQDGSSLTKEQAMFLGWSETQTDLITTEAAEDAVTFVTGTFTITKNTTLYAV